MPGDRENTRLRTTMATPLGRFAKQARFLQPTAPCCFPPADHQSAGASANRWRCQGTLYTNEPLKSTRNSLEYCSQRRAPEAATSYSKPIPKEYSPPRRSSDGRPEHTPKLPDKFSWEHWLSKCRPPAATFGQRVARVDKSWPSLANTGRSWSRVDQSWPKLARSGPIREAGARNLLSR